MDTDGIPSTRCTLQTEGNALPLSLVPAAAMTPLSFMALARSFPGTRPVHAFQAPGLEGDGPVLPTVEETAQTFVDDLLREQRSGPYLLGGHCLGGIVAFEMARRLETDGHTVAGMGG